MEKDLGSISKRILGDSLLEKTLQIELHDQVQRANVLESTLKEGRDIIKFLYDFAPVALFNVDCSELRAYLDEIKASGNMDLRSYFERHPEKLMECHEKYKMLNVNKTMLDLLEAEEIEDVTKNFKKTFVTESIRSFQEGILAHADGKNSYESTTVIRTLTGKRRQLALSWAIMPGYEKSRARLLGAMVDITDLRSAEDDLRRFKTIADNANVGNIVTDMDGTFLYVNKAFAAMHGYEADALTGRNVFMLHSADQIEQMNRYTERLKKSGSLQNVEVWHTKKDGTSFPTLMNVTLIKDGKGDNLYFSSTAIDITERYRMRKQLEVNNRNLEEANIALRVVIENSEREKTVLEEKVVGNIRSAVSPIVQELRGSGLRDGQDAYLDMIEATLNRIMEPFSKKLSAQFKNLSPTEIKVANLIREGKGTKNIAMMLHLSDRTVEVHRTNLRKKLGLTNQKVNLQTFLAGIR